ncbi:hypothetical protein A1O3_05916 [Capronia epimyces CBS 606.96]|uniref:Protein kinase domain-containing protein n=1 Tax=Capronia epimyces CBS 606.96 TaxID=1182542 RepID=W9Y7K9_9EURO|nr:uncharacterized protein A1O3_05916 [Capronia epimyces CBS 606.96]EXJ85241.1 hypothetical protein A1O3_05916 [Capronia epimyces CBS 606.96]
MATGGVAEAAALAGLIGFSFQCLAGCIKGFQLISTALGVGKHAVYFRIALLLEEQRLLSWSRRSGLSDEKADPRLPWTVIREALAELSELLCSVETLKKRYKLTVEPAGNPAASQDLSADSPPVDESLSFLMRDDIRQERHRILDRAKTIRHDTSVLKQFWFAAVDKEKFQDLLQEIANIIDKLSELLRDRVQDELREALQLQQYQNVVLASKMDELRSMIEANSLRRLINLPENSAALLKFISLCRPSSPDAKELEGLLSQTMHSSHSSLQPIMPNRFKDREALGTGDSFKGTISYDGVKYFFETKKYDWPQSDEEKKKVQDAIVMLALLLNAPKHPSFHTLDCFGIAAEEKNSQYLFLYRWPGQGSDSGKPRTLLDYLSGSYKPSLSARVHLARELARSLFLFHTANWMHKSFSSRNVLFFPRSPAGRSLESPYIVGFAYSRPAEKDQPSLKLKHEFESGIYHHPEYLDEASVFHKAYDIYSLGLVLLEISKWRPLKDIYLQTMGERRQRQGSSASSPTKDVKSLSRDELRRLHRELMDGFQNDAAGLREALCDRSAKDAHPVDVAFRAGDMFADAVFRCLGPEFDRFRGDGSGSGEDNLALQELFLEKVLRPLENCKA